MKAKTRYNVLSPDGFTITWDKTYSSPEEAIRAAEEWAQRYKLQGYYSSNDYGRIPLNDILDYCQLIEI